MSNKFFVDPTKSDDYNTGYTEGWKDCLAAQEENLKRKLNQMGEQLLQQFKPWNDLQQTSTPAILENAFLQHAIKRKKLKEG